MGIKSEDISISDEAIMDAFNIFADEEKTPEKRLYLCSLPEITLLKTKINQLKTIKSNMLYFDSQMIIINDKIIEFHCTKTLVSNLLSRRSSTEKL